MMGWTEERKAKANETRRRNKQAKADELAGLRQQIADLTQMNEDLSKNLLALQQERNMMEVSLRGMTSSNSRAAITGGVPDNALDIGQLAEASARRVLGLLAEVLHAAANSSVVDDRDAQVSLTRLAKADTLAEEPVEQTKVTVRNLVGNNNADLSKMTVQELNATAIELQLQTDFHRERLIQRITEARAAAGGE